MSKKTHSVLLMDSMRVERTYTGGKLLDEWQGIHPAKDGLKPEEWIASSTPSRYAPDPTTGLSRIKNDEMNGNFLKDYIAEDPAGVLGKKHFSEFAENQGFLTKIIDSDKRLNIQTHPDRTQAKILFDSDFGKSEAWYVMGGRTIDGEEPYILMGFKPGMTRERWEDLVDKQDITAMEESLHKVTISKGDVFFIPSGMPHAIGSGSMIAEIQEPTDITFRVEKISHPGKTYPEETYHQGVGYKKMFDCFDYTTFSKEEVLKKTKVKHITEKTGINSVKTEIINKDDTPFFSMDRVVIGNSGSWQLDNSMGFASCVILEGRGTITHLSKTYTLNRSDEVFLPCSDESYVFHGDEGSELDILFCYPPGRKS
jgi:mannose-6-phosphate isomerase